MQAKQKQRYSISVSGQTYARLRTSVTSGSMHKFVDRILVGALDDPAILGRLVAKCQSG
jgi:hypothetical protein